MECHFLLIINKKKHYYNFFLNLILDPDSEWSNCRSMETESFRKTNRLWCKTRTRCFKFGKNGAC